jgi:DNA-binding transcriptional ArsR family regulator
MSLMGLTIGTRPAKNALFDDFARVASALASGRRLEIIDILAQAPRSVEDVAEAINQSVANTSHHLRRLADDGLIRASRQGRRIIYELASDDVYLLWRTLQQIAADHHAGLDERAEGYLGDRSEIATIDHDTLRRRLDHGEEVVVIDVRPESEYQHGHLEGAISAPPDRLSEVLPSLPERGDIVAYCRGEYCAFADQAVRRLRATGRIAYRLDAGYRDWADRSAR